MKATHTHYNHPNHLRVIEGGKELCMSPSHSEYKRLNRAGLPDWCADVREKLRRDSPHLYPPPT